MRIGATSEFEISVITDRPGGTLVALSWRATPGSCMGLTPVQARQLATWLRLAATR